MFVPRYAKDFVSDIIDVYPCDQQCLAMNLEQNMPMSEAHRHETPNGEGLLLESLSTGDQKAGGACDNDERRRFRHSLEAAQCEVARGPRIEVHRDEVDMGEIHAAREQGHRNVHRERYILIAWDHPVVRRDAASGELDTTRQVSIVR